jgi:hypothetical protein
MIGAQRSAKSSYPRSTSAKSFGGNEYSMCHTEEPVNPVTTSTPSWAAARAVSFMRSAARWRTPSGSPSPHTSGGSTPA